MQAPSPQQDRDPWREKLFFFSFKSLCMLYHFSCVQLFVTSWTVARQALLTMWVYRQEYWSELPCLSPEDLPNPGIEPIDLPYSFSIFLKQNKPHYLNISKNKSTKVANLRTNHILTKSPVLWIGIKWPVNSWTRNRQHLNLLYLLLYVCK